MSKEFDPRDQSYETVNAIEMAPLEYSVVPLKDTEHLTVRHILAYTQKSPEAFARQDMLPTLPPKHTRQEFIASIGRTRSAMLLSGCRQLLKRSAET